MKEYNNQSFLMPKNVFEKFGALCGPLTLIIYLVGWPSAHFIPPLAPTLTAEQVTKHYRDHESAIKATAGLITLTAIPWIFWVATLSGQMSRIAGVPKSAIYAQLIAGLYTGVFLTLPGFLMAIAAYRLDRPIELTLLLNDICWILMASNFFGLVVQDIAFSYAVLHDHRRCRTRQAQQQTLFPHWLAYVSSGLTLSYWPAFGLLYVKSGVLAWNGALTFWVAAITTLLNVFTISFYLYKAISKEDLSGEGR